MSRGSADLLDELGRGHVLAHDPSVGVLLGIDEVRPRRHRGRDLVRDQAVREDVALLRARDRAVPRSLRSELTRRVYSSLLEPEQSLRCYPSSKHHC